MEDLQMHHRATKGVQSENEKQEEFARHTQTSQRALQERTLQGSPQKQNFFRNDVLHKGEQCDSGAALHVMDYLL